MKYKLPEYTLVEKYILFEDNEQENSQKYAELITTLEQIKKRYASTFPGKTTTEETPEWETGLVLSNAFEDYISTYKSNPDNEEALKTQATSILTNLSALCANDAKNTNNAGAKTKLLAVKDQIEDALALNKYKEINRFIQQNFNLLKKLNSKNTKAAAAVSSTDIDISSDVNTIINGLKQGLHETDVDNIKKVLRLYNNKKENPDRFFEYIHLIAQTISSDAAVLKAGQKRLKDDKGNSIDLENFKNTWQFEEYWKAYNGKLPDESLFWAYYEHLILGDNDEAFMPLMKYFHKEVLDWGFTGYYQDNEARKTIINPFVVYLYKMRDKKLSISEGKYIEIHNAVLQKLLPKKVFNDEQNLIYNEEALGSGVSIKDFKTYLHCQAIVLKHKRDVADYLFNDNKLKSVTEIKNRLIAEGLWEESFEANDFTAQQATELLYKLEKIAKDKGGSLRNGMLNTALYFIIKANNIATISALEEDTIAKGVYDQIKVSKEITAELNDNDLKAIINSTESATSDNYYINTIIADLKSCPVSQNNCIMYVKRIMKAYDEYIKIGKSKETTAAKKEAK